MDLATLPPSRIVAIARAARARPDTEFLCFGESDHPAPAGAAPALQAALARGDALYPDVRGVPALRQALAGHLTALHTLPVTEDRIQVTASGMTAVNVALASIVRAGDRVVLHTPAWPNPANAALLRGADRRRACRSTQRPDGRLPHGPRPTSPPGCPGARAMVLNSPNNPTGWTATHDRAAPPSSTLCRHPRRLADLRRGLHAPRLRRVAEAAPSLLDIAEPGRPGDGLQQLQQDLRR